MNKAGTELVFDVVQDPDGGYTANCLNEDIFTETDSWDELRSNVKDAVAAKGPFGLRVKGKQAEQSVKFFPDNR